MENNSKLIQLNTDHPYGVNCNMKNVFLNEYDGDSLSSTNSLTK